MDRAILQVVFEQLRVSAAREIYIDEVRISTAGTTRYVAMSPSGEAHIDRMLAIRLRSDGAIWCGEIARDPCAVA